MGQLLHWPHRRALPTGITIDQIADALEAATTARVSYQAVVRVKGRDIPVHGDGLVDLSRHIESCRLVVNGREVELLDVGCDTFRMLPANRQQATGKVWLWAKHCPYGLYWEQVYSAVRRIASCTGSGAESLSGEPVRRYSFLIKPVRKSASEEKDQPVAELYTHLRAHGSDRLTLDIWLAGDQTVCKVREHVTGLELALLDGQTNVVAATREYWDYGVSVDLVAPPDDQVLGNPSEHPLGLGRQLFQ
jgi:hypothetical protein